MTQGEGFGNDAPRMGQSVSGRFAVREAFGIDPVDEPGFAGSAQRQDAAVLGMAQITDQPFSGQFRTRVGPDTAVRFVGHESVEFGGTDHALIVGVECAEQRVLTLKAPVFVGVDEPDQALVPFRVITFGGAAARAQCDLLIAGDGLAAGGMQRRDELVQLSAALIVGHEAVHRRNGERGGHAVDLPAVW